MFTYTPETEFKQSYQQSIDIKAYWPMLGRIQHKLYGLYGPAIWQAGDKVDVAEATAEMLEFILGNFDVSIFSAQLLWQRMPYIAPQMYQKMLSGVIRAGLLREDEDGRYRFTDTARQLGWQIYQAKHTHLGKIALLPDEELQKLASILYQLVHASRVAAQPHAKRWLMSRCSYLSVSAPPLAHVVEYLADLDAFRDDCHLAAWHQYAVDGRIWETFTLLWRQGPLTCHQIAEQLNVRGYTPNEYEDALCQLQQCGWVMTHGNTYQLTLTGQQVRDEAEHVTDATFFAPWSCLRGNEFNCLYDLLVGLETAVINQ